MITQELRPKEQKLIQHCNQLIPGGYIDVARHPTRSKTDFKVTDTNYSAIKRSGRSNPHLQNKSQAYQKLILKLLIQIIQQ
ncbi:MAG: hypothetical protein JRJ39_10770 [Deltaproteobacteria bacterium]|nr:hypothetical protein [Deltaproteobacteria bacterium]